MKRMSMLRKVLRIMFAVVPVAACLCGCESTRHGLRSKSRADSLAAAAGEDDTDHEKNVASSAPKGFFKNNRLSGAMSSQGREIEESLGIK